MKARGEQLRRSPFLLLTIVILFGLALSVDLFFSVRQSNREWDAAEFSKRTREVAAAVSDALEEGFFELDALRAFYLSSYEVERPEFRTFVQHLLVKDTAIQALEWIPRVAGAQREEFESRVRAEGFPDFEITEKGTGGALQRAGRRDEYYPVSYVEPRIGNEKALGYDVASDRIRLDALNRARRSGSKSVTARVTLVQEKEAQHGCLVFQPLYRSGPPGFSGAEGQDNPAGFHLLVFRIGELLQNSLAGIAAQGVDVHLFDDSASGEERFLARYDSASGLASSVAAGSETTLAAGRHQAEILPVADRRWKIICTPRPVLGMAGGGWQEWVTLLAGLVGTGFLGSYLYLLLIGGETARSQAGQLEEAKRRLEGEVEQRRRAEEDLRERSRLAEMRADVGQALVGEGSMKEMLQGCSDALVEHLDAVFARIWTIDVPGKDLVLKASSGLYTRTDGEHARIAMGEFKIGRIAEERRPHLTNSVIGDPLVHDQEWARKLGIVSFAGHPLTLGGRLLGVMGMFSRRPLSEAVLTSLASVVDEVALGIQQKRSEHLVRAERDRAQNYFDVARVMLVVIGRDGRVSHINRRGCEILGYEEEEIKGQDWFENFLPEKDREGVREVFGDLIEGRVKPKEFYENTIVRKDGQERLIAWHNAVLRDEEGAVAGTLSSGEDVTGRRGVEQALRESEEKYRMLFTAERDAIVVLDFETGRIIDANEAALNLYGYPREKMLTLGAVELSADPERAARNIAEMSALSGREVSRHESYHRKSDGTLFPVEVSAGVFSLRGRRMVYAVFRDISERRRAEDAERAAMDNLERQYEELKEIDRMKDGLIRDVSHELKTPVAKHAMQLEILKSMMERCRLSEEETKALLTMEDSIRRQESVIRNLLDVSQLESGGRAYSRNALRIDELVRDVVGDYGYLTERYGIDVDVDLPGETIRSDAEMLWHLFSNLISNAIKFRKKKGPARIAVTGGARDGEYVVRVRDEGVGLDEGELARAFERFYQSSAAFEGSGVGLTICRMIARGLGGRIGIESEGKGRGATVTVRLPMER